MKAVPVTSWVVVRKAICPSGWVYWRECRPASFDVPPPGPPEGETADFGPAHPFVRVGAKAVRPFRQATGAHGVEYLGQILVTAKMGEDHAIDFDAVIGAESHGFGSRVTGGVHSPDAGISGREQRVRVVDIRRLGARALEDLD